MNDEFLYQEPPPLRGEFVDKLYVKISNDGNGWAQFLHSMLLNPKRWRVAATFTIGLIIIVACARLLLEPRNVQVGTMWVQEGGDTISVPKMWGGIGEEEPVLSSPPMPITADEAIGMVPYKMKVPEWTPEGFSLLQDTVRPPNFPTWDIWLYWSNSQNEQIELFATEMQLAIHVPRGMWEEVSVNGLPAVLVRGDFPWRQLPPPDSPEWNTGFELTWDKNAGYQLTWTQEGAWFRLRTFGQYLDKEDLIRMAESMRTW